MAGRGLALHLRSSFGPAASGVERLWSRRDVVWAADSPAPQTGLINAELGYGLEALDGMVTPYADMGVSGGGRRTYILGGRLLVQPSLRLELSAGRRVSAAAPRVYEFRLRGNLRW